MINSESVLGEFHLGEKWMQEKVHGKELAKKHRMQVRNYIRIFMPAQHQEFFEKVPWIILGTIDKDDGYPRASILVQPKFRTIRSGHGFTLNLRKGSTLKGDKVKENLSYPGAKFGMLGIELSTRRRNRLNGTMMEISEENLEVSLTARVDQSFGNCPKYIQSRSMRVMKVNEEVLSRYGTYNIKQGKELTGKVLEIVKNADTFFVASTKGNVISSEMKSEEYRNSIEFFNNEELTWKIPEKATSSGVDISHRGGAKGFIDISDNGRLLRWPDFVGNGFFNTLGNIMTEPRISILIIDFNSGDVLQVRGMAKILLDDKSMSGSDRVVEVNIQSYELSQGVLSLEFGSNVQPSPFNPALTKFGGDKLDFLGVKEETYDTRTFYFGISRPLKMLPGQYGTFRIMKDGEEIAVRAWTLSSTPIDSPFGTNQFAITVKEKKGGKISPLLNKSIKDLENEKLTLELLGVSGDFTLPQSIEFRARFAFIAAGSGITPVMSMLRRLASLKIQAKVIFSVKNENDVIFEHELQNLPECIQVHVVFTRAMALKKNKPGITYSFGRITGELLKHRLGKDTYTRAFICGPGSFAIFLQDLLNKFENIESLKLESYDF